MLQNKYFISEEIEFDPATCVDSCKSAEKCSFRKLKKCIKAIKKRGITTNADLLKDVTVRS